jgi:hypothetical protein
MLWNRGGFLAPASFSRPANRKGAMLSRDDEIGLDKYGKLQLQEILSIQFALKTYSITDVHDPT